jgi:hypothetical protein
MAGKISARSTVDNAKLERLLKARGQPLDLRMRGFAGRATFHSRQVGRERLQNPRSSGGYIDSIHSTVKPGRNGPTIVVEADSYGGAPDRATRPHWIFPRRARVLRFEVGGQVLFRPYVFHPGTKAQNILTTGIRRAGAELTRAAGR